jgi:hypothetical protein
MGELQGTFLVEASCLSQGIVYVTAAFSAAARFL